MCSDSSFFWVGGPLSRLFFVLCVEWFMRFTSTAEYALLRLTFCALVDISRYGFIHQEKTTLRSLFTTQTFVINLVIPICSFTGMFLKLYVFWFFVQCNMGWGSVVRISTRGDRILHLPRLVLGPTHPPLQWGSGLFPAGKVVGLWL